MYEGRKVSVLVNRAMEMFICPLNFRKPIYDGTILEGELYEDTFMVYDCLLSKGENIGKKDFLRRLECIEHIKKMLTVLKNDPIKFAIKTFHVLSDFEDFMNKYLPTVTQKIDGLVFTPVNEPVKIGTHETMFKWKPRDKNTVDFQFKRKGNLWRLYVQEKGKLIFESEVRDEWVADIPWIEEDAIIECQYMFNDTPMWWKPVVRRYDKTFPNSRRTFYRTLVNIKEDIKMDDFLRCT
tara:strand:- start:938 stop:1651 length:714 start_codon:yes stop_codon:yes gene_type:complete